MHGNVYFPLMLGVILISILIIFVYHYCLHLLTGLLIVIADTALFIHLSRSHYGDGSYNNMCGYGSSTSFIRMAAPPSGSGDKEHLQALPAKPLS